MPGDARLGPFGDQGSVIRGQAVISNACLLNGGTPVRRFLRSRVALTENLTVL